MTSPFTSSDLVDLTEAMMAVRSESFHERTFVDLLEASLQDVPGLSMVRIGDNLVARTQLGRSRRLVLAGHTDTVPAQQGNEVPRREGDRLVGLGACDMKGALACYLKLARTLERPAVDLTYVFYAREEVAASHSGLEEIFLAAPELLQADAAILGEPTNVGIEAGCQGTLRLKVTLRGRRAHTARAWMGRNAIHRLAGLLSAIDGYEPRRPVVEGLQFHEALQAVSIEGGVAGNVVPDHAAVVLNARFAPDRSGDAAQREVLALLGPHLEDADVVELTDLAEAAFPAVGDALFRQLIERHELPVSPKLGWTDVARFTSRGVPAVNFGPGDPSLAHSANEHVSRADLERTYSILAELVTTVATP